MSIAVRGIAKSFGTTPVLRGVSLDVADGSLVALLGPSGSGKTTLLRIIAGLEAPDEGQGQVLFDGRDVTQAPVQARGIGFVFQHYALFRHMTVAENISFGLRMKPRGERPDDATIDARVTELLHLVQLDRFAGRYPTQLSGGQRQRVALARALAVRPAVLLLDEPFGALDAQVRRDLRRWLRKLHDEVHVTTILVTHDQEEALEVADKVAILNEGRLEQYDTPETVYSQPANGFVYRFLGSVNLFHGRLDVAAGQVRLADAAATGEGARAGQIYLRPHELDLAAEASPDVLTRARVIHLFPAGAHVRVELLTASGEDVTVDLPHDRYQQLGLARGAELFIRPRKPLSSAYFEAEGI
jgi:sulfate/thiosulfate transport system ATP-binding protein